MDYKLALLNIILTIQDLWKYTFILEASMGPDLGASWPKGQAW
jgi:hypothetical protein